MDNLKAFKNILKMDLIQGFHFYKKKLILFLVIMIILNIGNAMVLINYDGTVIDLFFIVYKDVVFDKISFNIPMNWLIINIFLVFILGDFVGENLKRDSNYILLRSKKIYLYWISKCAWIIINVVFIYSMLIGLTYLIGGAVLGFSLGRGVIIDSYLINKIPHLTVVLLMVVTYMLTSLALVFLQCILSIVMNLRYSFLITTIIMTLSIVSENKFLIGTHSMALRHNYFNSDIGITMGFSIVYTVLISVSLMILGYSVLNQKDFI